MKNLSLDERIEDLLSRMELTEKIGQLVQAPMADYGANPEAYREGLRQGRWGSRILAGSAWAGSEKGLGVNAEELNEIQRIAVEESRLGIPLIYGRDVIHGQATVLPIPLAQAASFDPRLIASANAIVAREAASLGVHWTFAPMLDLCRDPRWGRIIEGYGEDPFLIARCGEAVIQGFQGDDPSASDRLIACAKHFCGYGGSEGGRDYDTTEWSENTLHNMVLPPFEAAVRAGVGTVMSGFNDLGGTPVSGHRALMEGWLKQEIGFAGFIVSDWGAVTDLIFHGLAADEGDAVEKAFNAGIDMEMIAEAFHEKLPELLAAGTVSQERLDDAVRRVLRIKFQAGLFDRPYVATGPSVLRLPAHTEAARQLCEESIVLLKNTGGLLPLRTSGLKVAIVGPFADARAQHLGSWCLDGWSEDVTTILEGVRKSCPDVEILTADRGFTDEMLHVARQADVVVLCVGESDSRSGEAHGISELVLPPGQEELIAAFGLLGLPLVVVQCSGRPLPSLAAHRRAQAWLLAWHGGTEAGEAIARILFGLAAPSGRLPMTIPRNTGQIPLYYNRKRPGKIHQLASYHFYQDVADGPLYPFGYGLAYTDFTYGAVQLSASSIGRDGSLTATTVVTNAGHRPGTAVVQLYLQDCVSSTVRPERELKGFQRIDLAPGESRTVRFEIGQEHLSFHGANRVREVEPGEFLLGIGADSTVPLTTAFRVEAEELR